MMGQDENIQGTKHDDGKARWDLVTLNEFAEYIDFCFKYNEIKYEDGKYWVCYLKNISDWIRHRGPRDILYHSLFIINNYLKESPINFLAGVVKVFEFGAKKYGEGNYNSGFKYRRLISASIRHVVAFMNGEPVDKESGLNHLYHSAWSLLILAWQQNNQIGEDDR